jgi:hypothetical protein
VLWVVESVTYSDHLAMFIGEDLPLHAGTSSAGLGPVPVLKSWSRGTPSFQIAIS